MKGATSQVVAPETSAVFVNAVLGFGKKVTLSETTESVCWILALLTLVVSMYGEYNVSSPFVLAFVPPTVSDRSAWCYSQNTGVSDDG